MNYQWTIMFHTKRSNEGNAVYVNNNMSNYT